MLCGRFSTLGPALLGTICVSGIVGVAGAGHRDLRTLDRKPQLAPRVDRQDVVLARLDVPGRDHLDQLRAVVSGDVVVLGEVRVDVIKLPALGIQLGQLVLVDRRAKGQARFGERCPRPRAHRAPAVVIDRAVPHHLEVLGDVLRGRLRIVQGMRKAEALDRRLRDTLDGGRRLEPSASSTVGTISMAWAYCVRISPFALIPFGQWTMNGSLMPPR